MKKPTDTGLDNGTGRGSVGTAGAAPDDALFGRVASILERARGNVVRAVKHNMVVAYWLIGREIVMELQRGKERAGYGDDLIQTLAERLTERYGSGYSVTTLKYFRVFYLAYPEYEAGKGRPVGALSANGLNSHAFSHCEAIPAFRPALSWSHYRALMRVENLHARAYYEHEAASAGWSKRELERQIHTHCYERLIATQMKRGARTGTGAPHLELPGDEAAVPTPPSQSVSMPVSAHFDPLDSLKAPYVLEFLEIPDPAAMH